MPMKLIFATFFLHVLLGCNPANKPEDTISNDDSLVTEPRDRTAVDTTIDQSQYIDSIPH
jgi:hypothetical protein